MTHRCGRGHLPCAASAILVPSHGPGMKSSTTNGFGCGPTLVAILIWRSVPRMNTPVCSRPSSGRSRTWIDGTTSSWYVRINERCCAAHAPPQPFTLPSRSLIASSCSILFASPSLAPSVDRSRAGNWTRMTAIHSPNRCVLAFACIARDVERWRAVPCPRACRECIELEALQF